MNEMLIAEISNKMAGFLSCQQLKRLNDVLKSVLLYEKQILAANESDDLLDTFLTAKEVEGCSSKTLAYYEATIRKMIDLAE